MRLHSSHNESMRTTAIAVAILAAVALLVRILPALPGTRGIANYLPLHMLLETFAITVALLIFAVGWQAQSRNQPGNIVLLACAFFGVGLLDFAHMLSYAGMPDFVTPSNVEKSIDFWLAARFMAAFALLAVVLLPWRPFVSAATRYKLLAAVIAATALAYWLFLFHQDAMPHTFIPGQGLTAFKIASEYAIVALNLATALMLYKQMRNPLPFNAAALFGAVCAMALSEFFFTLYANVTDIYNLTGHVYKGIAYLFLYWAIFVATVKDPYRQLQLSRAKLRGTLDAMPDLMWLKDADGVYLECNAMIERFFGASRADIIGKTDYDLLDKDLADFLRENDRKAMAAGKPSINEEWLTFADDGHSVLLETVKTPMRDEAGKLIGVLGIARDITARKEMEDALRRSESRLHMLYESTRDAVLLLDENGFLDCNKAARDMFGCATSEELCSKHPADLSPPEQPCGTCSMALATERIAAAMEKGSNFFEWMHRRVDTGKNFPADVLLCRIELDGRHVLQASVRDIAGRKRAEQEIRQLNIDLERRVAERTRQLETVNKELEAFSYSVSHDLISPLRSIDGFSRILSKRYHAQLDAQGQDYLERVQRATQHMRHLIDDMLQLSKVTRGRLKRVRVDLGKIAEEMAEELRRAHPARQVQFVLQDGLAVHADAGLMRIVMDNLFGNAWKYTGKKANAEIEFGARAIGGERTFFVRDNGAGFDMKYAHKLFGAFQRLHAADEYDGNGIGLATVQRIIHRHHGKIWAEAQEGQGATFYFTLPQRECCRGAGHDGVENFA